MGESAFSAMSDNLNASLFFANTCAWTNERAERICGPDLGRMPRSAINFENDADLEPLLVSRPEGTKPIITAQDFVSLGRGEFVLRSTDGAVHRINADHSLPAPDVELLGRSRADFSERQN